MPSGTSCTVSTFLSSTLAASRSAGINCTNAKLEMPLETHRILKKSNQYNVLGKALVDPLLGAQLSVIKFPGSTQTFFLLMDLSFQIPDKNDEFVKIQVRNDVILDLKERLSVADFTIEPGLLRRLCIASLNLSLDRNVDDTQDTEQILATACPAINVAAFVLEHEPESVLPAEKVMRQSRREHSLSMSRDDPRAFRFIPYHIITYIFEFCFSSLVHPRDIRNKLIGRFRSDQSRKYVLLFRTIYFTNHAAFATIPRGDVAFRMVLRFVKALVLCLDGPLHQLLLEATRKTMPCLQQVHIQSHLSDRAPPDVTNPFLSKMLTQYESLYAHEAQHFSVVLGRSPELRQVLVLSVSDDAIAKLQNSKVAYFSASFASEKQIIGILQCKGIKGLEVRMDTVHDGDWLQAFNKDGPHYQNLKRLSIMSLNQVDLAHFAKCSNLISLDVYSAECVSLAGLSNLSQLRILTFNLGRELSVNRTDINELTRLPNLFKLCIEGSGAPSGVLKTALRKLVVSGQLESLSLLASGGDLVLSCEDIEDLGIGFGNECRLRTLVLSPRRHALSMQCFVPILRCRLLEHLHLPRITGADSVRPYLQRLFASLYIHDGVHRSLGVHVSKVRSVTLDDWDESQYLSMVHQGNIRGNSYWEFNVFPYEKPLKYDAYCYRKRYIVDKYVKKKFVRRSELPPNDNVSMERGFDVSMLDRKGFLTKQGAGHKNWKRRFFVLHENTLSYFKQKDDSFPAGSITLEPDSVVMFVDENQLQKKHCFAVIVKSRNYYIFAESEQDLCEWVHALRAAVYYANLKQVLNDPKNFMRAEFTASVEKKGWLKKLGGKIRTMKRRYFVLKQDKLSYYNTEKDLEPIDSIDLTGSNIEIQPSKKKGEYPFTLRTTQEEGRQYYFVAETEEELKSWTDALQQVLDNMSDTNIIKKKSTAIHTLILSRMIHNERSAGASSGASSGGAASASGAGQSGTETISPHSPLMWRSMSFHRYKPNIVHGNGPMELEEIMKLGMPAGGLGEHAQNADIHQSPITTLPQQPISLLTKRGGKGQFVQQSFDDDATEADAAGEQTEHTDAVLGGNDATAREASEDEGDADEEGGDEDDDDDDQDMSVKMTFFSTVPTPAATGSRTPVVAAAAPIIVQQPLKPDPVEIVPLAVAQPAVVEAEPQQHISFDALDDTPAVEEASIEIEDLDDLDDKRKSVRADMRTAASFDDLIGDGLDDEDDTEEISGFNEIKLKDDSRHKSIKSTLLKVVNRKDEKKRAEKEEESSPASGGGSGTAAAHPGMNASLRKSIRLMESLRVSRHSTDFSNTKFDADDPIALDDIMQNKNQTSGTSVAPVAAAPAVEQNKRLSTPAQKAQQQQPVVTARYSLPEASPPVTSAAADTVAATSGSSSPSIVAQTDTSTASKSPSLVPINAPGAPPITEDGKVVLRKQVQIPAAAAAPTPQETAAPQTPVNRGQSFVIKRSAKSKRLKFKTAFRRMHFAVEETLKTIGAAEP